MSRYFFYYFICYICITGVTNAAYLRIYENSINNFEEFDLDSPLGLLEAPGYDPTSDTVIFAFGFTGKAEGNTVTTILGTYLRLGGYNAVLLNWEKEASSPVGPIYYPITALEQVAKVGRKLGQALFKLISAGLDLEKLHLIGFSLGAHLMGYTGREIKNIKNYDLLVPRYLKVPKSNKERVTRITGLDPAAPLFDERVIKPLDSDAARYVDVLHTNPEELGSDESLATIDFWFNCESSIQPGCESLSPIDAASCSHDRSWLYFSEALENKTAFEAISADSCINWASLNGDGYKTYVGENIILGQKGNYYLSTNRRAPYGKGAKGVYANHTNPFLLGITG